jgi:hypothetical protein
MSGRKGRSGRRAASIRPGMWARLCMTPPLDVYVLRRVPKTNGRRWVVAWNVGDLQTWEEERRFLAPCPPVSQLAFKLA